MIEYFRVFLQQFDWSALLDALQRVLAVLVCLTVHETCHGLAAMVLGDPTAKQMKRLSFNPIHHIDWLGLASMFICGFGWAKPVPVDMRYFKNPRLGMAVTALAGPASNFILSFLMLFGASLISNVLVGPEYTAVAPFLIWLFGFFVTTAALSVGLGLFNLLPIPPLDGSKILAVVLPEKLYYLQLRYERFGMLLLMAIIWLDLGGNYLTLAIQTVYYWMVGLFF